MRRLLPLLLLIGLAPARAEPVRFIAFGDMPYCRGIATGECADVGRVTALVREFGRAPHEFSIFLGDTKGGNEPCTEAILRRPLRWQDAPGWMAVAEQPVVYTPGDNEWVDCRAGPGGALGWADALALLRAAFFAGPPPLGAARQEGMPENLRWARAGVVFATLHIPGSNNGRPPAPSDPNPAPLRQGEAALAEYETRNRLNLDWLREAVAAAAAPAARGLVIATQADLFYAEICGGGWDSGLAESREAIFAAARALAPKPVLLLNGDSHLLVQQDAAHDPLRDMPANLTRLMVPGERDVQAVALEFDPGEAEPLRLRLLGEAGTPPQAAPRGCPAYERQTAAARARWAGR
ncbi:hypothetical protein JYK14_10965 [Siccirubricoccus sp. KC 17139]|uniref:Calcineurin-like phosphoesterase domain-containing protein n=1 Tax=Siccirubricoccus soli TaxID=2899147 RepID=A0ABT1D418_9PROT|nr:hypothetical protein [Siccirubricoccus soli]MCO6416677.1 hypothetical protein [Siccirubricoccus soli]MCP2682812.1 hypothetical protein [Siccirubricoccus soli]